MPICRTLHPEMPCFTFQKGTFCITENAHFRSDMCKPLLHNVLCLHTISSRFYADERQSFKRWQYSWIVKNQKERKKAEMINN